MLLIRNNRLFKKFQLGHFSPVHFKHQTVYDSPLISDVRWSLILSYLLKLHTIIVNVPSSQAILIFSWASHEPLTKGNYVYPSWTNGIGWTIAMIHILAVPLVAIIKYIIAIYQNYKEDTFKFSTVSFDHFLIYYFSSVIWLNGRINSTVQPSVVSNLKTSKFEPIKPTVFLLRSDLMIQN